MRDDTRVPNPFSKNRFLLPSPQHPRGPRKGHVSLVSHQFHRCCSWKRHHVDSSCISIVTDVPPRGTGTTSRLSEKAGDSNLSDPGKAILLSPSLDDVDQTENNLDAAVRGEMVETRTLFDAQRDLPTPRIECRPTILIGGFKKISRTRYVFLGTVISSKTPR